MIGEVVDTAITLGWAHAAPHVPLAAYLAMVVSVAALACGHQGEPFPPLRWWRAARGAGPSCARLYGRWRASRQREAVRALRLAHSPADARREPQDPSGAPCAGTGRPRSAPQTPNAPDSHPHARKPSSGHTVPSWARTDKDAA